MQSPNLPFAVRVEWLGRTIPSEGFMSMMDGTLTRGITRTINRWFHNLWMGGRGYSQECVTKTRDLQSGRIPDLHTGGFN